MAQDKVTIYGPKGDGTYVVEFKTAAGETLAISVPRGETRVLKYFQERMPLWAVCAGCKCVNERPPSLRASQRAPSSSLLVSAHRRIASECARHHYPRLHLP